MKIWGALMAALLCSVSVQAAMVERQGMLVTVRPDSGEARVVCLQVVNSHIIRVRATSDEELKEKSSLVVQPFSSSGDGLQKISVEESQDSVFVSTTHVRAAVSKQTGSVCFYDADGHRLLQETETGKRFWPYRVPSREIGVDSAKVTEAQRTGLQWLLTFEPQDEALYGLGQHQSEELNMKGKNEDLFQYNTKVSVPFVVSNRGYGLLWDAYSYARFGNPAEYLQLNKAFRLYDKDGKAGHLTGTYTDKRGRTLVRQEDSLYFEDAEGIKYLPQSVMLDGAKVVYEGYLEPADNVSPKNIYDFILYYAGYVKVFIDGQPVVKERWRTAWNPNSYKFTAQVPSGRRTPIRIEWQPDGGVSYLGLRATPSVPDRGLTIWNEMGRDMDYYFIAGPSMDQVISGYRTLTGRAPVYPKWVMGFWQSRERYKTQDELLSTLAEFRRRHIPIDNIVQDWNYWPEDQWGSHSFEASHYPDPQQMTDSVHRMHGRFMISVWPKFYCNTDHYKQLDAQGWMYHQAVADSIRDWVGPGYVGSFYDAYSEGARKMFWNQMEQSFLSKQKDAIDAWWMDASEPNVRDCTPMWYRKALCGPTALGTSTEYFNAYSLVNAMAIYDGQRAMYQGEADEPRVFLLTRSGFAGLQRYSTATWSGDIGTRWEDMRAQMTAGMNYSLSGLPFWGMDIGGFCVENRYVQAMKNHTRKDGQKYEKDLQEWRELQTRWHQFGCFVPLYRAHGQWPNREVWNIAPEGHPAYESIVWYHRLRYRLMPYLYSMAGWVHLSDYTMMRALVMDYGNDPQVLDLKDQWMFGPSLMACPVSEYEARSRSVYFPAGTAWYDFYTGQQIIDATSANRHLTVDAPYERIPVFVPAGGIIPFGPAMEWSDEKPADLIHLYVYGGRDGQFTLYEDEGTNYNYEQGDYSTIDICYDDAHKTIVFGQRQGSFKDMLQKRRFCVVYVDANHPRPLDLEAMEGVMVDYDGKRKVVSINK